MKEASADIPTPATTAISNAVLDAKSNTVSTSIADRLHYVEVNASGSPFVGNDICTDYMAGKYNNGTNTFHRLNDLDPLNPKAFHPTNIGQRFYMEVIKNFMTQ